MQPIFVDIVFAVLALLLCLQGWHKGFVKMAGSLIALAVSVVIATWGVAWFESVSGWHFSGNPVLFIIVFLLVTLVLTKLMGFVITLLDLARKVLSIIPGISMLNSILGFAVGAVEAGMVALAIAFATVNFFPQSDIRNAFVQSYTVSNAINALVKMNVL
ncbi:MAG: CvpA family protein [Patescibacteria group bacterium]|jgi:predicted CDP-diglyceride synthetase/phosphatidate cytidylyltransferase